MLVLDLVFIYDFKLEYDIRHTQIQLSERIRLIQDKLGYCTCFHQPFYRLVISFVTKEI